MRRKSLLSAAVAAALLFGAAGAASAERPPNDVLVEVTCPSFGTTQARIPNIRASLLGGKTLVTGVSTEYGPGIVFDVFDMYDSGRAMRQFPRAAASPTRSRSAPSTSPRLE